MFHAILRQFGKMPILYVQQWWLYFLFCNLARSWNLSTGLYILLALISLIYFFLNWAKVSQDLLDWFLRFFSLNKLRKYLFIFYRSRPFSNLLRDVANQFWANFGRTDSTRWRFEIDSIITILFVIAQGTLLW